MHGHGRRRHRPRRLYVRIYLHFLGVLLVVGLTSVAVLSAGWRGGGWLREAAARIARHIASDVGDRLERPAERDRLLARLARELEVPLTLRTPSGQLLGWAGRELAPPSARALEAAGRGQLSVRKGDGLGRRWQRELVTPVLGPDGRTRAVLQIAFVGPAHGHMARPVATLALVLLVVGVAVVPLARRISRPVERLTDANRRLGEGDLGYRIAVPCGGGPAHPHGDQLLELIRSWNEMADRIETLVRSQRELLANVSHELRSPLARMRVALELLPHTGDAPTDARVREVERDLAELDGLIEDVLAQSRLEATGLPSRLEPLSVPELCRQLVERAAHDPRLAGEPQRLELPDAKLPPLVADGTLLKRALWNLVENAAKYGRPPVVLRVAGEPASPAGPEQLAFTVSDQGPGIPAELREQVFIPFFRVDRARTPSVDEHAPGGFGLGLTFARRVAEVHGGTVRIEDGPGCQVTLRVPVGD